MQSRRLLRIIIRQVWRAFIVLSSWSTALDFVYVFEGVNDENRSLSLPLDSIRGIGVGVTNKVDNDTSWRFNVNYYDLG